MSISIFGRVPNWTQTGKNMEVKEEEDTDQKKKRVKLTHFWRIWEEKGEGIFKVSFSHLGWRDFWQPQSCPAAAPWKQGAKKGTKKLIGYFFSPKRSALSDTCGIIIPRGIFAYSFSPFAYGGDSSSCAISFSLGWGEISVRTPRVISRHYSPARDYPKSCIRKRASGGGEGG